MVSIVSPVVVSKFLCSEDVLLIFKSFMIFYLFIMPWKIDTDFQVTWQKSKNKTKTRTAKCNCLILFISHNVS